MPNTKSKAEPRISIKTMSSPEVYKVFPLLKFLSIFSRKGILIDTYLWKGNIRINNECTYQLYVIQKELYRHMKINVFGSVTVDPKHLSNI